MRPFKTIATSLMLVLILAACASNGDQGEEATASPADTPADTSADPTADGDTEAQGDPIKIGGTAALTGRLSETSQLYDRGYELCVEHINEEGGVLDRPLELVTYDDSGESEQAVALYQRLIEQDEVDVLIGPVGSELVIAAGAVAEQHQIPLLNIAGASPAVQEQGYTYTFAVLPASSRYSEGVIAIAQEEGLETFATLTIEDAFAQSATAAATERAREAGLELVSEQTFPVDQADFSAGLRSIQQADPDLLILGTQLGTGAEVLTQMRGIGFAPDMVWDSGGVGTPEFIELAGDAGNYVMGATQWEPILDTPGIDRLVEDYEAEYGTPAGYHTATACGAVQIYAEAIETVGEVDPVAIADWIRENEVLTAYGRFEVDSETGTQRGLDVLTVQWINGEKMIVWPDEFANAEPLLPFPDWDERG